MLKNHVEIYENLGKQMQKLGLMKPATMEGFGLLHKNALQSSALDQKTKELVALAIAIAVRCDGCIAFHTHDALKAGALPTEIADVIGVAILMGGGPSVVYGAEALNALEQFQEDKESV